jgi:hypothetical protein
MKLTVFPCWHLTREAISFKVQTKQWGLWICETEGQGELRINLKKSWKNMGLASKQIVSSVFSIIVHQFLTSKKDSRLQSFRVRCKHSNTVSLSTINSIRLCKTSAYTTCRRLIRFQTLHLWWSPDSAANLINTILQRLSSLSSFD